MVLSHILWIYHHEGKRKQPLRLWHELMIYSIIHLLTVYFIPVFELGFVEMKALVTMGKNLTLETPK